MMSPLPPSPAPGQPPAWHGLTPDEALAHWRSDADAGLSVAEAAERLRRHGPNTLPEVPPTPLWRVVAHQLASPLIGLLLVAGALAVLLGHHGDAGVILGVVILNALIGAIQEGRAERSMAALRQLSALQVRVLREGCESVQPAHALVPGDLLLLAAGDAVAADARVVEAVQLQVAEATLTGESVPVAKSADAVPAGTGLADRVGMVHSGTHVTAGRARAVVVATGAATEVGRIAGLTLAAQEPPTPLERRIERFGRALVLAALGLFVVVVVLGRWRGLPLAEVLMVAISQMVSMVPEGLPVAMTIALAAGMQRMAARGAIIRRLSAVETLGSTTTICSDKTGTLTRNEMTVTASWTPPSGDAVALRDAAALCNDADLVPDAAGGAPRRLGDPTEVALLVAAVGQGTDLAALRARWPRLAECPFDADTRLMATHHRAADGALRLVVKGAPEAVLRLCDDAATVAAARAEAERLAAGALRVLAVAQTEAADVTLDDGVVALAGRLRLLGLVGQIDPPRDEARAAVAACRAAGIRPVMITGDHPLTGLAIARALGIAGDGDRAIDGVALDRLDDAALQAVLPQVAVFARVQPAQKLRIVEALQARGEVVAMTGDGVNDAPALARADVGVAMGVSGTEVAKSASRIVLTDDSFATLVAAVEQGRVVYANLKKVILFLFATSVDEVVLLLLTLLAGLPVPLLAVQILWINLVTEATLTVNLVMDPPDGDEMRRAPVPADDPLIDRLARWRIVLMASMTVLVAFGWMLARLRAGVPEALVRTEVFTLVVLCQWFNVLNCRSATRTALTGLRHNRWLLGGLAASVVLQALVLYAPPLQAMFHTVALPAGTLAALFALASLVLAAEEIRKALARRRAGAVLRD